MQRMIKTRVVVESKIREKIKLRSRDRKLLCRKINKTSYLTSNCREETNLTT